VSRQANIRSNFSMSATAIPNDDAELKNFARRLDILALNRDAEMMARWRGRALGRSQDLGGEPRSRQEPR
jgi:hypothetical protein